MNIYFSHGLHVEMIGGVLVSMKCTIIMNVTCFFLLISCHGPIFQDDLCGLLLWLTVCVPLYRGPAFVDSPTLDDQLERET